MSNDIEKKQSRMQTELYVASAYEHLFPDFLWQNLPSANIPGALIKWFNIVPFPIELGSYYERNKNLVGNGVFATRMELPRDISKMEMRELLVGTHPDPDYNMQGLSDILGTLFHKGEKPGNVANAEIGFLRNNDPAFFQRNPVMADFKFTRIQCLGVVNRNKPTALIYFTFSPDLNLQ